jgi:hypothetical protein
MPRLPLGSGSVTARPDAAALQRQCDAFNARCPIGTEVALRMDCGDIVHTTTRTAAQVLSGHSAVIWLDKISGCYSLDRVAPIAPERAAA